MTASLILRTPCVHPEHLEGRTGNMVHEVVLDPEQPITDEAAMWLWRKMGNQSEITVQDIIDALTGEEG